MSESSKSQFTQEQGSDQPITLRYLIDDPILGWRTFPMAKALEVDPAHLLRLAMLEYAPDTWKFMENAMQSTLMTARELDLIRAYRAATGDDDSVATVIKGDAVIAVIAAAAVAA